MKTLNAIKPRSAGRKFSQNIAPGSAACDFDAPAPLQGRNKSGIPLASTTGS